MPFYNRPLVQPVGPYVAAGELTALAVYEEGGIVAANLTVASATSTQILAAPPAGMQWRLQRFACPDVVGQAAGVFLFNGSSFFSVLSQGHPSDALEGQLVQSALAVFNGTGASMRVTVTYDLVTRSLIT
jgi:hypothetical protein